MPSESPPYVVRGARGRRSRSTPGSAKVRHNGHWLGCPKPLSQQRPQVLDLRYPASADSDCPKPTGCGQWNLSEGIPIRALVLNARTYDEKAGLMAHARAKVKGSI